MGFFFKFADLWEFARCYKLFLPELEWGSITPVASGSGGSRLLKCTIVIVVIIQVQCNPWCFPRHNSKGIFCPVKFIHASCSGERWWLMKQPVERWGGACPQTSPALCQRLLPPGQGHRRSTQSHCRTAVVCLTVLEQFTFGTGLLPFFELQTEVIPGTTLLLTQRFLHQGQPLAAEQGKAVGAAAAIWFSSVSVVQCSPWPQGSALCE